MTDPAKPRKKADLRTYSVQYLDGSTRMVEGYCPRDVRRFVAKDFQIKLLRGREIYDLSERGVSLEAVGGKNDG